MAQVAAENEEALEAWDGVLFDRFMLFRHLIVTGLVPHGNAAMRLLPPQPGDRVLDVGCGFGDTALQLAELVGPEGSVLGVDVAPRFIEAARGEAAHAGVANTRFGFVTFGTDRGFEETFDYAFSRFGTMFFANPVAALRNVRRALVPGGRLCSVVWRRKLDNPWMYRAEQVVKPLVEIPEETDEPRCGPGPFSMADADTTSQILLGAGFEQISLHRFDHDFLIGRDLDGGRRLQPGARPGSRGRPPRGCREPRRSGRNSRHCCAKHWQSSIQETVSSPAPRPGSSPPRPPPERPTRSAGPSMKPGEGPPDAPQRRGWPRRHVVKPTSASRRSVPLDQGRIDREPPRVGVRPSLAP